MSEEERARQVANYESFLRNDVPGSTFVHNMPPRGHNTTGIPQNVSIPSRPTQCVPRNCFSTPPSLDAISQQDMPLVMPNPLNHRRSTEAHPENSGASASLEKQAKIIHEYALLKKQEEVFLRKAEVIRVVILIIKMIDNAFKFIINVKFNFLLFIEYFAKGISTWC